MFYQATMDAGYGIWTSSVEQKNPKAILDTQHTTNCRRPSLRTAAGWRTPPISRAATRFTCRISPQARSERWSRPTAECSRSGEEMDASCTTYNQTGRSCRLRSRRASDLMPAAPTALFKTAIPTMLNPYRMDYMPAADGQRFLMKVPVKETPPAITVVLNWPALLNRTETSK